MIFNKRTDCWIGNPVRQSVAGQSLIRKDKSATWPSYFPFDPLILLAGIMLQSSNFVIMCVNPSAYSKPARRH